MKQKTLPKDAVVLTVLPCAIADAVETCNELNAEHGGVILTGNSDQAAAGGSSGEAGPSGSSPAAGGMRLYLSQIREWIVEFSCDMLFISMRTDVAWYRLSQ